MDCQCCIKYGVQPNTAEFECPACHELICGSCAAHHKWPSRNEHDDPEQAGFTPLEDT